MNESSKYNLLSEFLEKKYSTADTSHAVYIKLKPINCKVYTFILDFARVNWNGLLIKTIESIEAIYRSKMSGFFEIYIYLKTPLVLIKTTLKIVNEYEYLGVKITYNVSLNKRCETNLAEISN